LTARTKRQVCIGVPIGDCFMTIKEPLRFELLHHHTIQVRKKQLPGTTIDTLPCSHRQSHMGSHTYCISLGTCSGLLLRAKSNFCRIFMTSHSCNGLGYCCNTSNYVTLQIHTPTSHVPQHRAYNFKLRMAVSLEQACISVQR
jgi:hypothetical protein